MSAKSIPIVFLADLPRCVCGAVLETPGLCAACADAQCWGPAVIPDERVIEPEDLRDTP